jgi:hypothetical protein
MRMLVTVSQAATGAKSIFLKVLDPFYKKKKKGAGALRIDQNDRHLWPHAFSVGLKSPPALIFYLGFRSCTMSTFTTSINRGVPGGILLGSVKSWSNS